MGKFIDLTGQRFGHLTVIERSNKKTIGKSRAILQRLVRGWNKERAVMQGVRL